MNIIVMKTLVLTKNSDIIKLRGEGDKKVVEMYCGV